MKNSTLLYVILSNLAQVIYYYVCYKTGFGLFLIQYSMITFWGIMMSMTSGKKILKFVLPTAIPVYLLSLIIDKIIILGNKLIIYLDSKEQIIK